MAESATRPTEALARDIRARLTAQADHDYRSKIVKLVPTEIEIVGVRVPVIRKLVKSFREDHPGLTIEDLARLLDRAFAARCREQILFATLLVAFRRKDLAQLEWHAIEAWVDGIEDWEVCDQLSMGIIGEVVAADLKLVDKLVTWAQSPDRWRRRAALAASTSLNRKGRKYAAEALRICEPAMTDDDRMVENAVGWALREATKTDADVVARFLAEWKDKASRRVLRAGSKKLDAAIRNALLSER